MNDRGSWWETLAWVGTMAGGACGQARRLAHRVLDSDRGRDQNGSLLAGGQITGSEKIALGSAGVHPI